MSAQERELLHELEALVREDHIERRLGERGALVRHSSTTSPVCAFHHHLRERGDATSALVGAVALAHEAPRAQAPERVAMVHPVVSAGASPAAAPPVPCALGGVAQACKTMAYTSVQRLIVLWNFYCFFFYL